MADKSSNTKKPAKKPSGLHISLAKLLKNIPGYNEQAKKISSLSDEEEYSEKCVEIILTFVQLFNCLEIKGKGEEIKVKASSESSEYFINSLAIFVENQAPIIDTWKRQTAESDPNVESVFNFGINFLYHLEKYRLHTLKNGKVFRESEVFMLVIKAKIKGYDEPMYLFQHNDSSGMLQMIGGKKFKKDANPDTTIRRIIGKELASSNIQFADVKDIRKLTKKVSTIEVSRKTGALSSYNLTFYSIKLDIDKLQLSSLERWVTKAEFIEGLTEDGISVRSPFENINKFEYVLNALDSSDLSLEQEQILPLHQQNLVNENLKEKDKLAKLLTEEESDTLEFKSSLRWDYRQNKINKELEKVIVKSISGFMNSQGGKLVIGIDDDKKILGLQKDLQSFSQKNTDSFSRFLTNLVAKSIGIEFSSFIKTNFVSIQNKTVCVVDISSSPQPIFVRDGEERNFYLRSANSTRPLNAEESYKYIQVRWR